MKISRLAAVMGTSGEWTGSAHRFYAKDDEHYARMRLLAARMERLPKAERIRWWAGGKTRDRRIFVEVAMH
jgi:hypothetical protein